MRERKAEMSEKKLPHDHGHDSAHYLDHMPTQEGFAAVAEVYKLLCDPMRCRIFWLLCHCEECVINLSAMVEMSSPAVSHHLKLLRSGGLIVSRREGKVYYKAADTETARLLHRMIEQVVHLACPDKTK